MADSVIDSIILSENTAKNRVDNTRKNVAAMVSQAKNDAASHVSEAEKKAEDIVRVAVSKAEDKAKLIKSKHEDDALRRAEDMLIEANKNRESAVKTVVRELIGKWQ